MHPPRSRIAERQLRSEEWFLDLAVPNEDDYVRLRLVISSDGVRRLFPSLGV